VTEDPPQGADHPKVTDRLANLARLWRAGNTAKQALGIAQAVKAGTLLIKGKVLFWVAVVVAALLALLVATVAIAAFLGGMPTATQCGSTSAATLAPAGGAVVGASEYGGPGDKNTNGDQGSFIAHLTGHMAFAELGLSGPSDPSWLDAHKLGDALGTGKALPPHTTLQITANGHSVIAEKLDTGGGGPPVGSPPRERAIDLWYQTAAALGLDTTNSGQWSGLVTVRIVNLPASSLTSSAGPSPVAAGGCATTATASVTASGSTIVQIAQSQLGTQEGANNCNPYGPCEPWCSDFLTWVWEHAGVDIPRLGYSGDVYKWGQTHSQVLPATATPAPGDAVEFGTGPNAHESEHVGIVEQVFTNGEITMISGNWGNEVGRAQPFQPSQATSSGMPGPVYGYVVP
jgi:hypothetical protein